MRRSRSWFFAVVLVAGLNAGCSNDYGSGSGTGSVGGGSDGGSGEYKLQGLSGSTGSCDPNYSGCVPMVDYDLDCPDVNGPLTVFGADPHGFDRDGDGWACENG